MTNVASDGSSTQGKFQWSLQTLHERVLHVGVYKVPPFEVFGKSIKLESVGKGKE